MMPKRRLTVLTVLLEINYHNAMPHSYNKIWVHAIWSTKERLPLIRPEVEMPLFSFIQNQLKGLGCPVRIVNGIPDHVHCLFLLSMERSVAEIVKQIKGSSSHFINQQEMLDAKFAWQTGYAAYSVSESLVDKVFEYIKNQKQHHLRRSFLDEYDELIKLHNASRNS